MSIESFHTPSRFLLFIKCNYAAIAHVRFSAYTIHQLNTSQEDSSPKFLVTSLSAFINNQEDICIMYRGKTPKQGRAGVALQLAQANLTLL